MGSRKTRTLMMWIVIIAAGSILAVTTVSFATTASIESAITILPAGQFATDIGGSLVQTGPWESFETGGVAAHFGGTYRPVRLQTLSVTVDYKTSTLFTSDVWFSVADSATLGILPRLRIDYIQQGVLAAYGFTVGMTCTTTVNRIDLAAEAATMHIACSETLGAEFGYPHTPIHPGAVPSGLNIVIGGSVRYPWSAPHAWLSITAHTSDADIAATTDVAVGETPPHTTITAAVRIGAITLNGTSSLSLVPYRVTAGTARATLRWNGLSFAVAGTAPTPTITLTIGYRFQV